MTRLLASRFVAEIARVYTSSVIRELAWRKSSCAVLRSTPAARRFVARECRLCRMRHSRHTAAMELLQAGVDRALIALWLGHESVETTQIYLDADLALKEKVLAKTTPIKGRRGSYRPDDQLLGFLKSL
jgi:integrase